MSEKSLLQLAVEYDENVQYLNGRIEKYRCELNKARCAHRNIEAAQIERKLTVLYNQRNELLQIADYLRTYYSDEMRCAV